MQAPIYVSKQIVLTDAVKIVYGVNKLRDKKPTYDVFLDRYTLHLSPVSVKLKSPKYPSMWLTWFQISISLYSAIDGPDVLAEELDLVTKMNLAVKDERYSDAGFFFFLFFFNIFYSLAIFFNVSKANL